MPRSSSPVSEIPADREPADVRAGSPAEPATVPVWDPFVRIFHWSLVTFFAIAFITGDELETLHEFAGYAVLVLIALRLVWGLVGTEHARFSSFIRGPRGVAAYLRDFAGGAHKRYLGHNPAGGAIIVVLLTLITVTAITGIMMENAGKAAHDVLEEVHEVAANLTLGLVFVHIAGVIAASLMEGENLAKAMINGRKKKELE